MNPILRESIEALSLIIDVTTGLEHPLDNSRAKEMFLALHKHGIELSAEDVHALALDDSWPEHHAQELARLAELIGRGGDVEISEPSDWGGPTVKRIASEIEDP